MEAVDKAFARGYFDEVLACKYLVQRLLEGEGVELREKMPVKSLPSYWDKVKINKNREVDKINEGTLAGKLKYLDDLRRQQNNKEVTLAEAKSILRHAQDLKCNSNAKSRANFAANAHFEDDAAGSSWFGYEKGFQIASVPSHPEGNDANMALVLENVSDNEKSGANQNVHLHQSDPGPVLVSAWSRPEGVTGIKDDGCSLHRHHLHGRVERVGIHSFL